MTTTKHVGRLDMPIWLTLQNCIHILTNWIEKPSRTYCFSFTIDIGPKLNSLHNWIAEKIIQRIPSCKLICKWYLLYGTTFCNLLSSIFYDWKYERVICRSSSTYCFNMQSFHVYIYIYLFYIAFHRWYWERWEIKILFQLRNKWPIIVILCCACVVCPFAHGAA